MKRSLIWGAATFLALSSVQPAAGAPVIYFGENQTPANTVSGAPLTARNNFFAQLIGNSIEDFEGLSTGSTPSSLTFTGSSGNITATLTGSADIFTGISGAGRFPTSGSNLLRSDATFGATFSTPISAFGFYGTDIGDFAGQLKITLVRAGGNETIDVPHTVGSGGAASGSLLFFGVIDTANPFTGVQFSTNTGADVFGFDDMTVGDVGQVQSAIPEPATWAMLIMGFGLVGGALRRRSVRVAFAA